MTHKLLLADDSVTIQRVIELTFADEDITVSAVSDGEQAVERIETDPPDIILADIGMPKRDGYQVASYVKSRPKLAHIPVVLLTGAFESVDQARAIAVGCDGVLAKPFEPQLVINRVKELLGAKPAPSRRTTATKPSPQVTEPRTSGGSAAGTPLEDVMKPGTSPGSPAATDISFDMLRPTPKSGDQDFSLDDYFDQLDAAFSNLGSSHQPSTDVSDRTASRESDSDREWPVETTSRKSTSEELVAAAPPVANPDEFDFSGVTGIDDSRQESHPREELTMSQQFVPPGAGRPSASEKSAAPVSTRLTSRAPIADRFAALLAAEQRERPASPSGTPSGPPLMTDVVVDQIVTRVLEKLSDKVVRDTVAEMVSRIAEKLVREEIERIKASSA